MSPLQIGCLLPMFWAARFLLAVLLVFLIHAVLWGFTFGAEEGCHV